MKDYNRFDLQDVKAKALPRLQWTEILSVTKGDLPPEDVARLTEYFSRFTLQIDNKCPGCDTPLMGDMVQQLLGMVTFTWGLTHGEGYCSPSVSAAPKDGNDSRRVTPMRQEPS